MRKLGIVTAVAGLLLAVFGVSEMAYADGHEESLCPTFTDNELANNFDQDPTPGAKGEPLKSSVEGAQESCEESSTENGLQPSGLLCGLADGLDARPGTEMDATIGSDTVGAANDGFAENAPDNPVVGFEACETPGGENEPPTTTTTDPGDGNGGGDDGPGPEVKGRNQTADGGLPRTGGGLFAGLGFGLAGVGALARRFLPIA